MQFLNKKNITATIFIISTFISGCAKDLDSDTYVDSSTVGLVLEGTILTVRPVKIKGSDKLGGNSIGGLAGGVAGGVAGSSVGEGSGKAAAVVGGAIAGAVIGAVAESQFSNSEGIEYIIRVAQNNLAATDKVSSNVSFNGSSISDKIKDSVQTNMKTEIISVVQGKDVIFTVGQKVYVIYSDDRPRVVAAQ
jgi:outer membrane lipoprotein SlyB